MHAPLIPYIKFFGEKNLTFVETGTYRGRGVMAAVDAGFQNVHSIEPVRSYVDHCVGRFQLLIQNGRVSLHHGSSESVLPGLVQEIPGPIFYWLDAHRHGPDTEASAMHCPLAREVDAICGRKAQDVVFIDDVRLLVKPSAWRGHDVVFERVLGKLMIGFPDHVCCFVDGHVKNDVLCLIPRCLAGEFFALRL